MYAVGVAYGANHPIVDKYVLFISERRGRVSDWYDIMTNTKIVSKIGSLAKSLMFRIFFPGVAPPEPAAVASESRHSTLLEWLTALTTP